MTKNVSPWQTMETAPYDGTEVLVYDIADGHFVAFWCRMRGCWLWTQHLLPRQDEILDPVRWQPLPDPPELDLFTEGDC